MNNKKGFTLIELLLTISIVGIVFISIFSFFIQNVKIYEKEDVNIELSQHGQFAIDFLFDSIFECNGIFYLDPKEIKDEIITVNKVTFCKGYSNFTYRVSNNSLKYDNAEVANYIEKMDIKLMPGKLKPSEYKKAKGISITLHLLKDNQKYKINNQINFRNK